MYSNLLAWLYSTKWQPGRQYTLQVHLLKKEKGPNPGNNQEARPQSVVILSEFLVLKSHIISARPGPSHLVFNHPNQPCPYTAQK